MNQSSSRLYILPAHMPPSSLVDAVQPGSVHGDLIVYLVRLANDTVDVGVLSINLLSHSPTDCVPC